MIFSKPDLDKINFSNQYKIDEALHRGIIVVLSHPFAYCRVLIQLGYEPLRPILVDTLFGGSCYAYPSVFKYISYIKKEDGLTGLFRGAGHRLCSELTREFFYKNSLHVCNQIDKQQYADDKSKDEKKKNTSDEESKDETKELECACFDRESIIKLLRKLCCQSAAKTISLTISYPIHVCFIRGCGQFIGREKVYNFNPFNLVEILKQGNLYDGFFPKLLAELLILWVSASLLFTAGALIEPERYVLGYLDTFINFFVSSTMYPLQLTSTIMAVNHSSVLLASKIEPPFYNWKECFNSLERRNQLKRGSSLIWRYVANAYKPQAVIPSYLSDD